MALLPLLASPAELSRLDGRPASDQTLVAQLREASRRFRSEVHHPVSRKAEEDLELDGSGSSIQLLPALPIVSIEKLEVEGTPLVLGTHYRLSKRRGYLEAISGAFPARAGAVVISYTAGYDATPDPQTGELLGLPEDIQQAVLGLAQILLNVTAGLTGRTVLGDTLQFGAAATVGSTQQWTDAVNNYKIGLGS